MFKKLRVAVIGCGNIAFFYDFGNKKKTLSYVSSVLKLSKYFDLVSVADKDKDKLNIIKNINQNINFYNDYEKMLQNEKIDICVIATQNKFHYKILKAISYYNLKAVITEKPFVRKEHLAKEILKIYNKKKIILSINYSRRFSEEFNNIKKIIKKKKITTGYIVTNRGIINNGSHYIDLLISYFGNILNIEKILYRKSLLLKKDFAGLFKINFKKNIHIFLLVFDVDNIFIEEILFEGKNFRVSVNSKNLITINHKIEKAINYNILLINHLKLVRKLILKKNKYYPNLIGNALKVNKLIEEYIK